MLLTDIIQNNANKFYKKKAIVFDKRIINYGQLSEYVDKIASGLMDSKVKKGSKVALLLKNSPEFIISYFAILKCASIVVPLNYMFKEEELKYILEDSGCCCIITSSEFVSILKRIRLRVDKLKYIFVVDKKVENTIEFPFFSDNNLKSKDYSCVHENEIASILYTSGTTGRPKGVMLTHKNLVTNAKSCVKAIKINKRDKFLCFLPMFHSFTWTVCVLIPLYLSSTIFILKSVSPFSKVIKSVIKNRITIFVAIPAVYKVLSKALVPRILKWKALKFLNPLRICISGAASLSQAVIEKFKSKFNMPLLEGYGLTEASPVVSINPINNTKCGSVGLPLPGIEVKVVDEKGYSLPFNTPGELLVKGKNVMKGYYNLPEETKEVLQNGWLYTKDIAKIDEEGYIYIIDRKTDMIIVRGQNVYPREIEEVFYYNKNIEEVAVVGVKDDFRGEIPKAYVVLKKGRTISEKKLFAFLKEKMASYKIPKKIEFVESLPKSSTGKILKKRLK